MIFVIQILIKPVGVKSSVKRYQLIRGQYYRVGKWDYPIREEYFS